MVVSDIMSSVNVYFHHQRLELMVEQDRISEPETIPKILEHKDLMSTPSISTLPGYTSPHRRWFLPQNCS